MRIMSRDDVETHSEGYYGPQYPAVNVKVYHFPSSDRVVKAFGCDEETAERAIGFAFDMAQSYFWEGIADVAESTFGCKVTVSSAGRSGGWLVVDGLPDLGSWSGRELLRWTRFVHRVEREIAWLCSWEHVKEDIEANRWAEAGAEAYNFIDHNDGTHACLVDLKRERAATVTDALREGVKP